MDNFGGFGVDDVSKSAKRKRSIRPRHSLDDEYQYNFDNPDKLSKASSEENSGHGTGSEIEASLNNANLGECTGSGITKFKKLKLKVGGVTRTINTTSSEVSSFARSSSVTSSDLSGNFHTNQDGPNDNRAGSSRDQRSGMRGIPWKDFSKSGFRVILNRPKQNIEQVGMDQSAAHKSNHAHKKRSLGEVSDDEDEEEDDDEIRYLEKLRTARLSSYYGSANEHENVKRTTEEQNISTLSEDDEFFMDGESLSDDGVEVKKDKQAKKIHDSGNFTGEVIASTRQRALKRGIAVSSIEFPNGLPPPPSKRQKEKLSEVEQQLKKAEAAQRRKIQNEKAAREAEAEAIRKILGQDSTRKKQEVKLKKRQEELAQKRAANSILSSYAIRWTIGPSGTIVTFPDEIGLPSIFESKHCSYPLPREKCAGPSCTNAYKYRDSKSKLPLCSLQCYKALK